MLLRILPLIGILPFLVFSACSSGNNESQASGNAKQEQTDQSNSGLANVKDDESQRNILQITLASNAHSTLAKAVKAAELQNTLSNPGPFTAFAPTDKAFQKVPEKALKSLMKPENKKQLATVLQRHVAPVGYDRDQLKKMANKNQKLFMANGDYLTLKTKNGDLMVKDAKVLKSIKASNGMIHVVDKVILPEN
jgi:uncharacterized surface protein with fasciclin (FAS1) repeats